MKVLSTKGWSVEESEPEFTQPYDTSGYAKAAEEKAKRKDETPDTDTVSGGGWTVPTSEAGIAETTDAYKAPEKTKYKYTMDSLETNDEWNNMPTLSISMRVVVKNTPLMKKVLNQ